MNIIEKYGQDIRNLFFKYGFDHDKLSKILTMFHLETIEEKTRIDMSIPKSKFTEDWDNEIEALSERGMLNPSLMIARLVFLIDKHLVISKKGETKND